MWTRGKTTPATSGGDGARARLRRIPTTWIAAGVVAVLAAVGLVLSLPTSFSTASLPGDAAASAAGAPVVGPVTGLARRTQGDPTAIGAVSAPVVMVAYSDFQCPFCGKFARDTEPALIREFVDTGVLRIEWRDFPYLGPESTTSALAGRAAAAQGKFWQFHDVLCAKERKVNSGELTDTALTRVAADLGLDVARFRADMASQAVGDAVQADFKQGQQVGVSGTPAFIINGTPVLGAQPLAQFQQVIRAAAGGAA